MYNVGYQLLNPVSGQMYQPVQTMMTDRALINQRLQALMNMSCLRMRGLPFSAVQKDILSFLGNHTDSVIGAVHIIYNLQVKKNLFGILFLLKYLLSGVKEDESVFEMYAVIRPNKRLDASDGEK